jgi:hypothetical protein
MRLFGMFNQMLGRLGLGELSRMQKLYLALILAACCLVFYAVGIITNFFASPVFSMFFVISYDTAHNIVSYVAIAMAVSLSIAALAISLVKRRKSVLLLEPEYEPAIDVADVPTEALVQATSSVDDQKIISNPQGQGTEQEDELNKQPVMRSTMKALSQAYAHPNTNNDASNNQEPVLLLFHDQLTCPTCKREFSNPVFMLDYSGLRPRLIRRCPYCDLPADSTQNAATGYGYSESSISVET